MLRMLTVGSYQANCYILGCKNTLEGIVIDPGAEVFRIVHEISRLALRIKYIFLTHGHIDHTGGASELKRITGASVWIHSLDEPALDFAADGNFRDGDVFTVGTYTIEVLHTPGHTPGSVCFHAPGVVFTGDTLFAGSVGRTDFPGSSHSQLISAVRRKIFPLGDEIRVYPGHGPPTTIGRERLWNPFFIQNY